MPTDCRIRVLVVDNYDSFTYNLVQALERLRGIHAVVVRNDDPSWRDADLGEFDCVVLSPGPGRPDRPADFGICRTIIEKTQVPLLGVCLGHEGICHAFGGTVTPAPEPRHGRASFVQHSGDVLFGGIPSPFRAVRYHSLMAGSLPGVLDVIASADDGVPMGLRHRSRPIWGVQFHPESVGTEHGEQLLSNFIEIAGQAPEARRISRTSPDIQRGGTGRAAVLDLSKTITHTGQRPAASAECASDLHVLARHVVCRASAEQVFDAFYRDSDYSFWLDSGMRLGDAGRFSFMGDAAGPLARTVTADVRAGDITVTGPTGRSSFRGSFFDWIRVDLCAHRAVIPPLP
ncbi:MAG: gamma-glutamyl-gamma-aminobutyrate hydrolase family protein, partial [Nocardiopsaceae bacterium]|nr:gamma-glutamyl-gamma-aminobutyrate hydrolase family protein [Nocardiopsaceae bacterium]